MSVQRLLCACPRNTYQIEQALDRARRMRARFEDWGEADPRTLEEINTQIDWLMGLLEKAMAQREFDSICPHCLGVITGMSLEGSLI